MSLEAKVSCHTCVGACCVDSAIPLDPTEAAYLRKSGTVLEQWEHYPRSHQTGWRDVYKMVGKCGNLKLHTEGSPKWRCAVHEDDNRPLICKAFEAGSEGCLKIRTNRGI